MPSFLVGNLASVTVKEGSDEDVVEKCVLKSGIFTEGGRFLMSIRDLEESYMLQRTNRRKSAYMG